MECNKHNPKRVKPLDEECKPRDNSNKRLTQGCTSLMYACQQGQAGTIVKELITKPKSVRQRDRSYKSALHYCSGQRDLIAAASVAVAAPELMESADEDGFTPLHLAVIQGNMAMVNLLLANKADVNVLDHEGHSVVHWATVCGEVEALRSVLQAGGNVTTPDINGGSPLHYAAQMCGANYDGKVGQSSTKLALEILAILLGQPQSSVDVVDKDGRQPLLWAASAGSAKAVIALVKGGARVESADKDGLTALHCAASRGHTECINTLIGLCGAPTDLIDSNGCTALHYAVTLGHADATARLLELEADPNRQDRKGRTPAHCGCAKGQFETVKMLKERGANLWLRNAKGDLPVHEAAASGRRELVEWLLEQKPKQVNTTSNDGRTFLHIASGSDYMDMCKMLLDFGADVNSIYRNPKGIVMTPLDCALQKGFRSTAKFLQSNGGLPASKLRLSARRPNAFNDQELVKPLKYVEKEEVHDLKSAKKYVVYIKKSDSESEDCSCTEKTYKPEHVCKHHRKKFRRRTSSCGDPQEMYKDDSGSDMARSKSNLEIRRKRSHDRSYSSDEEDSCENCCRHRRKLRQRRKDRTPKKSKEAITSDNEIGKSARTKKIQDNLQDLDSSKKEVAIENTQTDKGLLEEQDDTVAVSLSRPDSSTRKRPQSAKKKHQKEATFIKNEEIQQNDVKPDAGELTDEEEVHKSEIVVTQADVHKTDDDVNSQSLPVAEHEITETISKELEEVFSDAKLVVESVAEKTVQSEIGKDQEMDAATEELAKETSDTKPDMEKVVSTEKTEETGAVTAKLEEEEVSVETVVVSKKMSEQEREVEKTTTTVISSEAAASQAETQLSSEQPEAETEKDGPTPDRQDEGRKSFTLLPDTEAEDQPPRKSSFTILKSDESVDVEEAIDQFNQEEARSFQVVEIKQPKTHTDVDYSTDEEEHDEDDETASPSISQPVLSASRYGRSSTQGLSSSDASGRKRRLKRRAKHSEKPKVWGKDGTQQASKDQDSGFEPSPRALKTKIPSPRSVHTAILPRRPIYATLDGRSCSSRLEARKLGDRNAVNMTAVTKSIQKNIRRYYMERKIFQHLLELKSLQIRSSKLNESVLVKRAVDDYHKSCISLGSETGGTLRRYPYSEYTFKNFEMFLYETLKSLQKSGTYNFQNINEVYEEAERRLSPDYSSYERALHCTTKTHRCLHAAHAYTGIPCAAYIPMMNHHTMPKYGFGPYKKTGVGSFYLPKILTSHSKGGSKVSLELSHGKNKQLISLPSDKLDSNKRYYVTFTVKGSEADGKAVQHDIPVDNCDRK